VQNGDGILAALADRSGQVTPSAAREALTETIVRKPLNHRWLY